MSLWGSIFDKLALFVFTTETAFHSLSDDARPRFVVVPPC